MQPDLSRLIRELKKETCPQRVRDLARERMAVKGTSPAPLRFAISVAIACMTLACSLAAWQWHMDENARRQSRLAELNAIEHARIANQAEGALGLVGSVLLNASVHSEQVISDRAVPPLRSSLETAKNKITEHMEL